MFDDIINNDMSGDYKNKLEYPTFELKKLDKNQYDPMLKAYKKESSDIFIKLKENRKSNIQQIAELAEIGLTKKKGDEHVSK